MLQRISELYHLRPLHIHTWQEVSRLINSDDKHIIYRIWSYLISYDIASQPDKYKFRANIHGIPDFITSAGFAKNSLGTAELFLHCHLFLEYRISIVHIYGRKNKEITVKEISKELNISDSMLIALKLNSKISVARELQKKEKLADRERFFRSKAEEYFSLHAPELKHITAKGLCNFLGINWITIKNKHPILYSWIASELKRIEIERSQCKLNSFIIMAGEIINQLRAAGNKININKIMKKLSMDQTLLYKHPEYMEALINLIIHRKISKKTGTIMHSKSVD